MSVKLLASFLLINQVVEAQSAPRFDAIMEEKYPEYSHEVLPVRTQDGYILNLLHIWKPDALKTELHPVLFQHGGSQDGTTWLTDWEFPAPAITLAADGHHVYLGNNRGTEYSRHSFFDKERDADIFWDFSWDEMAFDVKAFSQIMYSNSGGKKGYYVGYSTGTTEALVALSKFEYELNLYLNKVILLAPCYLQDVTAAYPGISHDAGVLTDALEDIGVYAISGPEASWKASQDKICAELDPTICEWANFIPAGIQPMTTRTLNHFMQNSQANIFQEYKEDFDYPNNYESEPYRLEDVTQVPISLIVASEDHVCPIDQAEELASQLQSLQSFVTLDGIGHEMFSTSNEKEFVDLLKRELNTDFFDAPNFETVTLPSVVARRAQEQAEEDKQNDQDNQDNNDSGSNGNSGNNSNDGGNSGNQGNDGDDQGDNGEPQEDGEEGEEGEDGLSLFESLFGEATEGAIAQTAQQAVVIAALFASLQ